VNIDAADLKARGEKVKMAQALVYAGYDPAEVLSAMELPAIEHTGLPSSQLQQVAQIDPANPESVYEVE